MYFQVGGDVPAFAAQLSRLHQQSGETVLLFAAASEAPRLAHIIDALRVLEVPFFGGIFPAVYRAGERFQSLTRKSSAIITAS
ncbi:MAG: hypothetical protein GKR94_31705 [Gammaproteobacteria bacterium]|nr:hypothetical protein [Gammaproteobacteria bacterium]